MRKKILIGSAAVIMVLAIVYFAMFGQAPSTSVESSPPATLPTEETPPNLLVIPEVPLGTLAIILACFLALVISQRKPKAKLR